MNGVRTTDQRQKKTLLRSANKDVNWCSFPLKLCVFVLLRLAALRGRTRQGFKKREEKSLCKDAKSFSFDLCHVWLLLGVLTRLFVDSSGQSLAMFQPTGRGFMHKTPWWGPSGKPRRRASSPPSRNCPRPSSSCGRRAGGWGRWRTGSRSRRLQLQLKERKMRQKTGNFKSDS